MNRLDEIRARLAAATPGEWRATHGAAVWARQSDCDLEVADCWSPAIRDERCQANADLIANAPAYLRELLAVARAAATACNALCGGTLCRDTEQHADTDGCLDCVLAGIADALVPLLREVEG